MKSCYYCGTTDGEFRPYGPNWSDVCFTCGTSPENIAETDKNFRLQLEAIPGIKYIDGSETGPRALFPDRVQQH